MTFYLLGTGAAVSDPHRTTTMFVVTQGTNMVLVDCGGDAFQRMLAVGLDPADLDAVILTHEHPDHVSGYPLLVEKLWLHGRREPLPVFGPGPTLRVARTLFQTFATDRWEGLPNRTYHEVPLRDGAPVLQADGLSVTASPVDHPVPTIGLRFENASDVLAYSCDTAKTGAVVALAQCADVLIHEASGSIPGVHSSPEEAAEMAAEAGAGRLILVHLPAGLTETDLAPAREIFPQTELGQEMGRYEVASSPRKTSIGVAGR